MSPTNADKEERRVIPQPAPTFLVGNILDLDANNSIESMMRLARIHGEIYQLKLLDMIVVLSSQELCHYVSDESKFEKFVSKPLQEVRNFAGDGLFTAWNAEHNWTLAHRILIPAFGPLAIKKMQPMMLDVITQMLMFWEHHAGQPFEAADQYTRLTFVSLVCSWLLTPGHDRVLRVQVPLQLVPHGPCPPVHRYHGQAARRVAGALPPPWHRPERHVEQRGRVPL